MFTDIAAYSRLMEEDEQRTIDLLKEHNRIVFPLIEAAEGEVIDAIGDGLLVLFPTVRNAVTCAGTIHEAIAGYNREAPEERQFLLRIGVHLGEIWREEGRVFGNGVNVAARIQPHAAPGGICISEDVYRVVSNKLQLPVRSLGKQQLRNIARPIELFAVATGHEAPSAPVVASEKDEVQQVYDTVKQRLIEEREKTDLRRQSRSQRGETGTPIENRIESKVFGLVEHVMDRALEKWDSMPPEKKAKTIEAIRREASNGDSNIEVHLGRHKHRSRPESGDVSSELVPGLVFGIGFGLGYFAFSISWMVWPFAIIGVLPFSIGLVKSIRAFARRRQEQRRRPQRNEQALLSSALELGGTVTVVQLASHTGLSLDEVQTGLDRMAAKGYVHQHIDPEGIIRYEFPSLAGEANRGQEGRSERDRTAADHDPAR